MYTFQAKQGGINKIKLFCLPYAGGSATIYWQWKKYMHSSIQICPVEMAARGSRFSEPFYKDMAAAVEDLLSQIVDSLDGSQYAFFGHSMGSLIVYELVHALKAFGYEEPQHIFFSGRYPPHIIDNEKLHLLHDDEFMKEIFKYGGFTQQDVQEKELLDFLLPILKEDYKLLSTYNYKPKDSKFGCDITILNGLQDDAAMKFNPEEWKDYTNKKCLFYTFEGGHFFIKETAKEVVEIINHTIGNTF
ncbi:thioesterase II family protein [Marinisporobacter balticus]|uniref:Surfactin synthase thioesterase subunit n=1 Tax=Marinisporobacter balticus TaxID=2018667 RepID=A0A4R2KUL4_9FIRM|nr:thioesterase domain-containing protein [Marinisporobacter balticus]TCO70415.1 surfactin synthase thioesterase subunit [Marinisporobacter balticus]